MASPVDCSWRAAMPSPAISFAPTALLSINLDWFEARHLAACCWADDQDRGERGAHPGRAGSGADDAFHGAVGATRRPVIALRVDLKVVVAIQPVDFRKSAHTLSALVSEALHANPYCGDLFVFRSKRMDRSCWPGTEAAWCW
jgi:IS66 Orf2 like protein